MPDPAQHRGVNDADRLAEIEQRLRQQVAACTLMLNDLEILGYSGHVSARLPGGDTFLIQSFDQSRAELRPEMLLVCDLDGKMLSGPPGQRPPAEVFLHCELLRARPDVNSAAHFHHDRTTVFTLVQDVKLVAIKNHAVRWASGIPVHEDPSHLNTPERGRALAGTLGPHHAALIRAHGQVVVAEDIPGLLIDCVHFVENAEAMYDASLLGAVRPLTESEIALFLQDLKRDKHVPKLWNYYVGRARARGVLPQDWVL
ncbi:class II aldolase/adducin family protein [Caulobacter sp. S45]|jgi:L-ribulose-5-phosphate 4-epimerase|uniref:class II aldolase/adducin family protein n=1 Tax=Caulobacter sp. S45 TaxID=1641861 RepID=UPI00131C99D3|nr:class II aldolase/adducin family protein [Caulobacter sp. S45]